MTNNNLSYVVVLVFVCVVGCASNGVAGRNLKTDSILASDYCVAQTTAPQEKLQGFIDYVCGAYGCGAITWNGPCFLPNNLISHASFVLDLAYKITGKCNTEIGARIAIDPSYDSCHYP